jgi:hypothetical protein
VLSRHQALQASFDSRKPQPENMEHYHQILTDLHRTSTMQNPNGSWNVDVTIHQPQCDVSQAEQWSDALEHIDTEANQPGDKRQLEGERNPNCLRSESSTNHDLQPIPGSSSSSSQVPGLMSTAYDFVSDFLIPPEVRMNKLQAENKALREERRSLRGENRKLQNDCGGLRENNRVLFKDLTQVKQDRQRLHSNLNASIRSGNEKIEVLNGEIARLQDQCHELNRRDQSNARTIEQLQQHLTHYKVNISSASRMPDQVADDNIKAMADDVFHSIQNFAVNFFRGSSFG